MNRSYLIILCASLLIGCADNQSDDSIHPVNWNERIAAASSMDSLESGASYLSVYSEIYSQTEHKTHNLTVTVSLRNTNKNDSVFIENADYYNTNGNLIRTYFSSPIFIRPLETVEIVIHQVDKAGGTGGNFLFDWKIKPGSIPPYFEAVMISTSSQQGLSFSTQGIRIE